MSTTVVTATTASGQLESSLALAPISAAPLKAQGSEPLASGRVLAGGRGDHRSNGTISSEQRSVAPDGDHGVLEQPRDQDVHNTPQGNGMPLLPVVLGILQPALINLLASFTTGTITVALPTIARSVDLPRTLYLWPASVYGLTSGSILLLAGSIADLVGPRLVELTGVSVLAAFTMAAGLAKTGEQLVAFRAIQGVGIAMHLPASVSLVTAVTKKGRARNIGFACLGFSQPIGFSVGLVLGGVLAENSSWRIGFYVPGALLAVCALVGRWALPKVEPTPRAAAGGGGGSSRGSLWTRFRDEVDWVGVAIASSGLTLFSYVLSVLSADLQAMRSATPATLLGLSIVLIASFPLWMSWRTRLGKPALVPNSFWRNVPFTSVCVLVTISWGTLNSIELLSSLYFQEIQRHSSLTASLFLMPNVVVGTALSMTTGVLVHRLSARWLIAATSLFCGASPLLMALVDPSWSYWYGEFWAQALSPVSVDVLFPVGLIIVSDSFPERTQALAGAVFNTVGQLGLSLGVAICQVVALGVAGTGDSDGSHGGGGGAFDGENPGTLLRGYRASFWAMFAQMMLCTAVAIIGLRKVGKVGVKRE